MSETPIIFGQMPQTPYFCSENCFLRLVNDNLYMATKKELEQKKDIARLYFMQGEQQNTIADRVGVSRNTVSRWAEQGGWEEKRAAMSITRPELVTKTLSLISRLIDKLNADTELDLVDVGRIVDQLCKLSATIERIDKKASVVDNIETFTALNKWLEARMEWDKEVTPEFMRMLTHYQDLFISEQVQKKH